MPRKAGTTKKIKRSKNTTCYFTESGTEPNYKEVLILRRFISERGKILPQKITGLQSNFQRQLSTEIKKARYMALLPYTDRHTL
jgi:small subunit ribosomal protein S18